MAKPNKDPEEKYYIIKGATSGALFNVFEKTGKAEYKFIAAFQRETQAEFFIAQLIRGDKIECLT